MSAPPGCSPRWMVGISETPQTQGAPEVEAARPHPQSIQGGWFVWPRSKLGGGGSYSSIRAGAIYRLQYGASPAAGSAVAAPIPSGHLPWEPLPPYLVAGGSWPSKRAHMTHIPPCLQTHTHTLSRLWAWVRGDSSCSTRRSWGAASESIVATLRALPALFRPYTRVRPAGASDLERFALGKFALKPSSDSGFEDTRTETGRGSVAYLVGR